MNMAEGWIFWALLSAVFAAATTVFARIGVAGVDADLATLLRTVLILLLLATLVGVRRKWLNPASLPPRTLLFLALSALATGASWVCYFRALQIGRASQVAPVDRLSLVLVALFAFAFLGERPTGQDWLGISLVTAGVLALTLK
jgi:transporter family protein